MAAAACCLMAANSFGATIVSGGGAGRAPTSAEITNDGSLAGKTVYDFFVNTDSDILSIDNVVITGGGAGLYQNPTGSDVEPPIPAFVAVFPALGADSWISTPGGTSTAGGGFANDNSSWFDTTNDGAQANFQFARLTTSVKGTFSGRVNTLGSQGEVINTPFSLPIGVPEPATLGLAGMSLVGLLAASRRRTA
jgi:hypothetical protein